MAVAGTRHPVLSHEAGGGATFLAPTSVGAPRDILLRPSRRRRVAVPLRPGDAGERPAAGPAADAVGPRAPEPGRGIRPGVRSAPHHGAPRRLERARAECVAAPGRHPN